MPIEPNRIACKDGVTFFVKERATGAIVLSALRDDSVSQACGLWRYRTAHRPGELYAEHQGMPVERVRAYALGHGGVAEGGPVAVALLKRLPSEANQGAEGVAPQPGFRSPPGGSDMAGRPASEAPAGASAERDAGGPAALEVDTLTPALIEARKVVAEFDGPFLHQGREPATDEEARREWERRCFLSCRVGRLFPDLKDDRFARHPLRAEALALRERLTREIMAAIPHLQTATRAARAG